MSVIVRDSTPDDHADVGELTVAAYQQFANDFPPAVWRAYRMEMRAVAARAKSAAILVADADGELAGTVTYYPKGGGEDWEDFGPGWASVRFVAVAPEFRGRGIGKLLMRASLDRARAEGAIGLGLHTIWLMDVAKGMYESMGFEQMAEATWEEAGGKYWRYELRF